MSTWLSCTPPLSGSMQISQPSRASMCFAGAASSLASLPVVSASTECCGPSAIVQCCGPSDIVVSQFTPGAASDLSDLDLDDHARWVPLSEELHLAVTLWAA